MLEECIYQGSIERRCNCDYSYLYYTIENASVVTSGFPTDSQECRSQTPSERGQYLYYCNVGLFVHTVDNPGVVTSGSVGFQESGGQAASEKGHAVFALL